MAAAHVAQDVTRGATIFLTLAGAAEMTGAPAASRAGAAAPPGPCFAAGTLVAAERGLVPIETIAVGERVWSRDEATGEVALRTVTRTFETADQPLLALRFGSGTGGLEEILATAEPPVLGRGYRMGRGCWAHGRQRATFAIRPAQPCEPPAVTRQVRLSLQS